MSGEKAVQDRPGGKGDHHPEGGAAALAAAKRRKMGKPARARFAYSP
jgi:hypothetical protein